MAKTRIHDESIKYVHTYEVVKINGGGSSGTGDCCRLYMCGNWLVDLILKKYVVKLHFLREWA